MTCGAGTTLSDASEPALVEVDGLTPAFLAYASVFPIGYEARFDRPGLAPMRAYNHWRNQYPLIHEPGRPPVHWTLPDQTDLDNVQNNIRRAKERADVVFASFHWGDCWRVKHLTDHEKQTARFAVDHGADVILGHHHHAVRGIEWYRGRPILYGLGHFVFDSRAAWIEERYRQALTEADPLRKFEEIEFYWPREGWPLLPMHEDTRMTLLAWATLDSGGIDSCGFMPCKLTPDGLVHPLHTDSDDGRRVARYVDECNQSEGLQSQLTADGAARLGDFDTLSVVPR
jgi:poly-gamma-glutamate synthesis protein (capsule biosynthesis protein)